MKLAGGVRGGRAKGRAVCMQSGTGVGALCVVSAEKQHGVDLTPP